LRGLIVGLSALDVAFISALAAVTAAIAAPISAWVVARANNTHDRWAKVYGDLHVAYTSLLQDLIAARASIQRLAQAYERGDPESYEAGAPPVDEATRIQHRASVSVLASPEVGRALAAWDRGWREHVSSALAELSTSTEESGEDDYKRIAASLRSSLEAVEQSWQQLCSAIRIDLRNR
jgi:hypothetical protein